jgi:hypothetical protein
MVTALGCRSWFWVCRPSMIVAVPGGFWVTIQVATMVGGFTGVAGALLESPGATKGKALVEGLLAASDEELQARTGAIVYRVADLLAIECKRPLLATHPDFVACTKDGERKKYGLGNSLAFDRVVEALRCCYGDLVQRP